MMKRPSPAGVRDHGKPLRQCFKFASSFNGIVRGQGKGVQPCRKGRGVYHSKGREKNVFHKKGIEIGIPSSPPSRPKKVTPGHSHFPPVIEFVIRRSRLWKAMSCSHAACISQSMECRNFKSFICKDYLRINFITFYLMTRISPATNARRKNSSADMRPIT